MIYLLFLIPIISLTLLSSWVWAICRVLRFEQDYLWLWLMILLPPIGFPLYLINFFLLGDEKSGATAIKRNWKSNRRLRQLKESLAEASIPANWEELAGIYIGKENWEEALKALKHSLDADAENIKIQYMAAQCLIQLGKFEAALPHLEYIYDENPSALSWQPALELALTLGFLNQPQRAEKVFRHVLSRSRTPAVVFRFARYLTQSNQEAEATELLENILHDYDNDGDLLRTGDQKWLEKSRQLLKEIRKD
jgi:hypothetical protein